jgi:hypothetical protein
MIQYFLNLLMSRAPRMDPGERTYGVWIVEGWVGPTSDLDTEAEGKPRFTIRTPILLNQIKRYLNSVSDLTALIKKDKQFSR